MIRNRDINVNANRNALPSFKIPFDSQLNSLITQTNSNFIFPFKNETSRNIHLPPKSNENKNKKTLILDLDETLVHSGFTIVPNHPPDITINVEIENKIHNVYILVRPRAEEFIEKMSKLYEIVIFTASLSKYANPLLDKLDSKKLCSFRLFREHCSFINNAYVKDLKNLGRDMKDVIIVDNSPVTYSLNVENGFPIKTWIDDITDRELIKIIPILEYLSKVNDVRDYIKLMIEKNQFSYAKADKLINKQKEENKTNTVIESYTKKENAIKSIKLNNNYTQGNGTSSYMHYKVNHYQPSNVNNNKSSSINQSADVNLNKQINTFRGGINVLNVQEISQLRKPSNLKKIYLLNGNTSNTGNKTTTNAQQPYRLSYHPRENEINNKIEQLKIVKFTCLLDTQIKNTKAESNNSKNENFNNNNHLRNYSIGRLNSQRHPNLNLNGDCVNNYILNHKEKFSHLDKKNNYRANTEDLATSKRGCSTTRAPMISIGNFYVK